MGKWNLDILYTGFDTEEYKNDLARLEEIIPEYAQVAEKSTELSSVEFLTEYVKINEEMSELIEKLAIYANLRYSANTRDTDAVSYLVRFTEINLCLFEPHKCSIPAS